LPNRITKGVVSRFLKDQPARANRLSMSASPGSPGLMLAPLATMPAVESLAADRATGIGPGAAAARRGARRVGGIERRAVERLAGLDPCAARHRAGIKIDWFRRGTNSIAG
jgi:hypothetical protein